MHHMYRVDDMLFDSWHSRPIQGGFTDTFELFVNAVGALPPHDYAEGIESIARKLSRLRPRSSLWVRVYSPENTTWYRLALADSIQGVGIGFAVTSFSSEFDPLQFTIWPVADRVPTPRPPEYEQKEPFWSWPFRKRFVLQTMARLEQAYSREVASMTGLSLRTAQRVLRELADEEYIESVRPEDGYSYWRIRRKGLSAALRLWRIPPGETFFERRERETPPRTHERGSSSQHNRTKRLWGAWLRKSVLGANLEIHAVWSEVALPVRTTCDALAWATYKGQEVLFWLEVLSAKKSLQNLRQDVILKTQAVSAYLWMYRIPIVIAFLGRPWTLRALEGVFGNIPEKIAVVAAPWRPFGRLPEPGWGDFRYILG